MITLFRFMRLLIPDLWAGCFQTSCKTARMGADCSIPRSDQTGYKTIHCADRLFDSNRNSYRYHIICLFRGIFCAVHRDADSDKIVRARTIMYELIILLRMKKVNGIFDRYAAGKKTALPYLAGPSRSSTATSFMFGGAVRRWL